MDRVFRSKKGKDLLTPTTRPKLAAKARMQIDKVNEKPILLYPEGVLLLNETGAAIVQLCNGEHSYAQILTELAKHYGVTVEEIQEEISSYILDLYRHSLIELPLIESAY